MDRQKQNAIESLLSQISNDDSLVKCQKCNSLWPIVKQQNDSRLIISYGNGKRIAYLQKKIKWAEKHPHYIVNNNRYSCEAEKQELAELLKEEKKREILRRIPLYSTHMTGYRFVCSKCYDEIYLSNLKK